MTDTGTTNETPENVGRFGITFKQYSAFLAEHLERIRTLDKARESDGMLFYDWEAAALRRVFELFADDPEVCGILCTMMKFTNEKDAIAGR